jgi:hypothetical protein
MSENNNNTPTTGGEENNENNQNNQNNGQNVPENKSDKTNEAANNLEFGEEIRKMLPTAGTLELNKEQKEALYAPVVDSDVYIKPDGLIYLSWIKYSGRLTKAFTGTGWTMLPQGMPKGHNNMIVWGFHLVIKGVYCGFAIGEQQYFANGRMTYGEACEGAKSNALMRLCKALGIGLELWDKEFIERWLATYAVKNWVEADRKYKWALKPNAFGTATVPTTNPTPVNPTPAATTTKATPTPTVTPTVIPTKPAPAKAGKKGAKLPENKDFLKGNDVPIEKMTEEDVTGQSKRYTELHDLVSGSATIGQLKMNYDTVKTAHSKAEVTEEEKEILRKLSNQLFVKLSTEGK